MARVEVANVAVPALKVPVPIVAVPSLKITLPPGVPLVLLTVAVNVTDWLMVEGLTEEMTLVVEGIPTTV